MDSLKGVVLDKTFPISHALKILVDAIHDASGVPIAVGGCVRDHLLGKIPKDVDVEIYGISLENLELLLSKIGAVHQVGRSFGVLKVRTNGDMSETFDVSLPRTENKVGQGHKGFIVETKDLLDFKEASARRDFTINAMGINLLTQELLDPHGGVKDLKGRMLRHVSDAFTEDPLRVFRGCQFASRFEYEIHKDTLILCQKMKRELKTLPKERIVVEIQKLLLGERPSLGLEALKDTLALEYFPELEVLQGCEQEMEWHPEGDVWIHTKMVVDSAAKLIRRDYLDEDESIIIMLGALCHDLGKPATTELEDGRIRSRGHESAGEGPTRSLLERMGFPESVILEVISLVREHLKPHQLYRVREEISSGTIRRLANRVSIRRLCLVSEADFLGRTTEEAIAGHDPATAWLRGIAASLNVVVCGPQPILKGRHLIEKGVAPGPKMGEILKNAYEAQLDETFNDLEGALAWLEKN